MVHLDKDKLSKRPLTPCKLIDFEPDDFWDEDQSYEVYIASGSGDEDSRPYKFIFTDGLKPFSEFVKKSDEARVLFEKLGIIPEHFLDGNGVFLKPFLESICVASYREGEEDKLILRFYFYEGLIEFMLYDDISTTVRPSAIIEIPDDSQMLIKVRNPSGYTYYMIDNIDTREKCNGECPDCHCGGSVDDYQGC